MTETATAAGARSMRDDTVRKATGRGWAEWFALPDELRALCETEP